MRPVRTSAAAAREIAVRWLGSGISQEEFAKQHGITSRTLRNYLRTYVQPVDATAICKVIDDAIADLVAVRRRVQTALTSPPLEDRPLVEPDEQPQAPSAPSRPSPEPSSACVSRFFSKHH